MPVTGLLLLSDIASVVITWVVLWILDPAFGVNGEFPHGMTLSNRSLYLHCYGAVQPELKASIGSAQRSSNTLLDRHLSWPCQRRVISSRAALARSSRTVRQQFKASASEGNTRSIE